MTADEVAKEIQRFVRNQPEELGDGAGVNPRFGHTSAFFLALLAFPLSGGRLATKP